MAELCAGSSWMLNISWTNRRLQTEVALKSFGSDTVWHQDPNRKKNEWQVAILATAWDTSLAGHANCSDSLGTLDWYHKSSRLWEKSGIQTLWLLASPVLFLAHFPGDVGEDRFVWLFVSDHLFWVYWLWIFLFRVFRVRSKCRNFFVCSVACPQWR